MRIRAQMYAADFLPLSPVRPHATAACSPFLPASFLFYPSLARAHPGCFASSARCQRPVRQPARSFSTTGSLVSSMAFISNTCASKCTLPGDRTLDDLNMLPEECRRSPAEFRVSPETVAGSTSMSSSFCTRTRRKWRRGKVSKGEPSVEGAPGKRPGQQARTGRGEERRMHARTGCPPSHTPAAACGRMDVRCVY